MALDVSVSVAVSVTVSDAKPNGDVSDDWALDESPNSMSENSTNSFFITLN